MIILAKRSFWKRNNWNVWNIRNIYKETTMDTFEDKAKIERK
jgi:hypothetical protein